MGSAPLRWDVLTGLRQDRGEVVHEWKQIKPKLNTAKIIPPYRKIEFQLQVMIEHYHLCQGGSVRIVDAVNIRAVTIEAVPNKTRHALAERQPGHIQLRGKPERPYPRHIADRIGRTGAEARINLAHLCIIASRHRGRRHVAAEIVADQRRHRIALKDQELRLRVAIRTARTAMNPQGSRIPAATNAAIS